MALDRLSGKIENILQKTDMSRRLRSLEDALGALYTLDRPGQIEHGGPPLLLSGDQPNGGEQFDFAEMNRTRTPNAGGQQWSMVAHSDDSLSLTSFPATRYDAVLSEPSIHERTQEIMPVFSTGNSIAESTARSVFSGLSLSDVSILSQIALPVRAADISNPQHYVSEQPTATKAQTYTARYPTKAMMALWASTITPFPKLGLPVFFETPDIFLFPFTRWKPNAGTIRSTIIDGSSESLRQSKTELLTQYNLKFTNGKGQHKFGQDMASWITLLSALHQAERDSGIWETKAWESSQYAQNLIESERLQTKERFEDWGRAKQKKRAEAKGIGKFSSTDDVYRGPRGPEWGVNMDELLARVRKNYSLRVSIKREVRSWDEMPPNFKKPCATTTWPEIIELAALLGLCWAELDTSRDAYRAVGNGFSLTGRRVKGLGVVFEFCVSGESRFEDRIIPSGEVTQYCHGFVPTIFWYNPQTELNGLFFNKNQQTSFEIFSASSVTGMVQFLHVLGCTASSTEPLAEGRVVRHVFPGSLPYLTHNVIKLTIPSCF